VGYSYGMLFSGIWGITAGLLIFLITWLIVCLRTEGASFIFDVQGEPGTFEKLLAIYIDLAKFVLGLAAGSIALIVGLSASRSGGRLPESFAAPLFLLGLSIICGILFMVFLVLNYEHYRHHGNTASYTRFKYTRNQALGFGGLSCFCAGYVWLIVIATR
jgi:hypothetical protein